ncbi:MAG: hypothetical protein PHE55_20780 [Methylococcaceae bacterium]|nr:hypothetical protein [Methylococcaceae bacterium]
MKTTLYIGWKPDYTGTMELTVWNTDYVSEKNGYINVITMETEVPTSEPSRSEAVAANVAELRREQGKLMADVNRIESKIQELLCIDYEPEEK